MKLATVFFSAMSATVVVLAMVTADNGHGTSPAAAHGMLNEARVAGFVVVKGGVGNGPPPVTSKSTSP